MQTLKPGRSEQVDSSYTTAFAMYSSRKIGGCPLNASDRMCQALNTELEVSAGDGDSRLKAVVHVFHARRMEHWSLQSTLFSQAIAFLLIVFQKDTTLVAWLTCFTIPCDFPA